MRFVKEETNSHAVFVSSRLIIALIFWYIIYRIIANNSGVITKESFALFEQKPRKKRDKRTDLIFGEPFIQSTTTIFLQFLVDK